jgi:hypothetical protein
MLQNMRDDNVVIIGDLISMHDYFSKHERGKYCDKEEAVPDIQGAVDALAQLHVIVS